LQAQEVEKECERVMLRILVLKMLHIQQKTIQSMFLLPRKRHIIVHTVVIGSDSAIGKCPECGGTNKGQR